jgi:hypothetical protein
VSFHIRNLTEKCDQHSMQASAFFSLKNRLLKTHYLTFGVGKVPLPPPSAGMSVNSVFPLAVISVLKLRPTAFDSARPEAWRIEFRGALLHDRVYDAIWVSHAPTAHHKPPFVLRKKLIYYVAKQTQGRPRYAASPPQKCTLQKYFRRLPAPAFLLWLNSLPNFFVA